MFLKIKLLNLKISLLQIATFGAVSISNGQTAPKLPVLKINTASPINPSRKTFATIEVTQNSKTRTDTIGIEYHGNSTLNAVKHSYDIEFRDSKQQDKPTEIFGFPMGEDFILLANYFDRSFVRNAVAFKIWSTLGYYTSRYQ